MIYRNKILNAFQLITPIYWNFVQNESFYAITQNTGNTNHIWLARTKEFPVKKQTFIILKLIKSFPTRPQPQKSHKYYRQTKTKNLKKNYPVKEEPFLQTKNARKTKTCQNKGGEKFLQCIVYCAEWQSAKTQFTINYRNFIVESYIESVHCLKNCTFDKKYFFLTKINCLNYEFNKTKCKRI